MARPGLERNAKFKMLCRLLGEPRPHVRGYLETLWEVAYEHGNPEIGDADSIEAGAEYPGERHKLFNALLECGGTGRAGFIEEIEGKPGQYQIHDLFDHAPDYVRKRWKREQERKSNNSKESGGQRRTTADNGAESGRAAENGQKRPDSRARARTHSHINTRSTGGTDQKRDSVDVSKAEPFARKIFSTIGYSGTNGGNIWGVAALMASGKIPEHWMVDSASGTKNRKSKPDDPPAYFYSIVDEHARAAGQNLKSLLKTVRIVPNWPTGPPAEYFPSVVAIPKDAGMRPKDEPY